MTMIVILILLSGIWVLALTWAIMEFYSVVTK